MGAIEGIGGIEGMGGMEGIEGMGGIGGMKFDFLLYGDGVLGEWLCIGTLGLKMGFGGKWPWK